MPETDIGSTTISNISAAITEYSVAAETTEGAGTGGELRYNNTNWTQDYGYYKKIPEFKTAVDAKATWTVGAGFDAEPMTLVLTDIIKGNGKDTFLSILRNLIKVKTISGDAFAEIIVDEDGVLANLKPLDPSSIVIVQDNKGRIKRYEQINKVDGKVLHSFEPRKMFHLSHDRMADEIKGTRILDSLQWLILARNEAMSDWKTVLHRNVHPLMIFHLDTDDTNEINTYKAKMDEALATKENLYVPKGAVVPELVSTATNATLSPLGWIAQLNDYFFQAVNVPQIIIGNAKEFTDASAKIVYLSYEQSVKGEQLYLEEQILNQLKLEVVLRFPASLEQDTMSGMQKESSLQASTPNDTAAEMEGRS